MKTALQSFFSKLEKKERCELLLGIIIIAFVVIESPELNEVETFPDYSDHVVPYLDECKLNEYPTRNGIETRSPLKWWSLCLSDQLFGNERIIPFVYSIVLIPITYSFVTHLTKRKGAGLVTVLILVTSGTFTFFDTTSTYEQSWVVFLLLSLIMIMRGSTIGMILFLILAILSKPHSIVLIPILYYFARHDKGHMKMALVCISLAIITLVMIDSSFMIGGGFEFNHEELLHGFYNWWFYLNASLFVAITLPLVIWKLFSIRKKEYSAKPILFAIMIMIISVPLIDGFTNQLNHSYRFTPMIIFVATGIGIILTNFATPTNEIFNIRKNT